METIDPSPPPAHYDLEPSQRSKIVCAAILVVTWIFDVRGPARLPPEVMFMGQVVIERIASEELDFPAFGFSITPKNGWHFLKVTARDVDYALNLAHYQGQMIAKIDPVTYPNWPPKYSLSLPTATTVKTINRWPKLTKEIRSAQYRAISIDWYLTSQYNHSTIRNGRFVVLGNEFRIRVLSFAKATPQQNRWISDLCNEIVPDA